jgi:trk system potassium uptake protein TrkA
LDRHLLKRRHASSAVLVIGLGRFGSAVASSLIQQGREVLAVDTDPILVQRYADELTYVVQADTTDDEVLEQLGVRDFEHAVVAIGQDIEASVLTTLSLAQAQVKNIWAKAISRKHGEILDRVGAHRVFYPETSVGEQVAHLIVGGMSQYLELEDGFVIARTLAPREMGNRTLEESGVRTTYGVTVVGIKRVGQDFIYAKPDTVVDPRDELVIAGATRMVERFCALTDG